MLTITELESSLRSQLAVAARPAPRDALAVAIETELGLELDDLARDNRFHSFLAPGEGNEWNGGGWSPLGQAMYAGARALRAHRQDRLITVEIETRRMAACIVGLDW